MYCGTSVHLTYPTIDTLAKRITELGTGCLIWKHDLTRYFCQVPLCPRDYSLIRMRWKGLLYFDKVMPMGIRSATYVCQCIMNAIIFIHRNQGYWSTNYLDDFGSAEHPEVACLANILAQVGLVEAADKAVMPSTNMDFLGTNFDTCKMIISVSETRRQELMSELNRWNNRT